VPVHELQTALDSVDFAELLAFKRYIEPIGDERADAQAALVAYHAANAFGGGGKSRMRDYVLKFEPHFEDTPSETPQQRSERIKASMAELRARQQVRKAKQNGNNR